MKLKFYISKKFDTNSDAYLFCGDINDTYRSCVINLHKCNLEYSEQIKKWHLNKAYIYNPIYIGGNDFDYNSIMFEIENKIKNQKVGNLEFEQLVDEFIGMKNAIEISDKELKNIIIDYSIPSEYSIGKFEYQLHDVIEQYNNMISIENQLKEILK